MDQHRQSLPLEFKFDSSSLGSVKGYASVWGGPPDSYGDIIQRGAFAKTIAEHKAQGSMPIMLWAHDQTRPVGRWTSLVEDSVGLAVEGVFNLDTAGGKDAAAHVKAGDISGFSIGYVVPPGGVKRGKDGSNLLTEIHLLEISVVALPANSRARVMLDSKRDLEELLVKSGLARTAAVRLAGGGWPALAGATRLDQSQIKNAAGRIGHLAEKMRKK